ncbi:D-alanyl-lipoteichoic acid biosynthesis protein DltD [Levilactobacillus bambusae]|uniref:Protein DltD n=1 Tax=Levilactobacillus bambusae TaxID=2024736 RepID=A0A2V1N0I8_9LACO|nr:D-alanyl-lipoteichoic acid biosynthesis protein DltD [Levilactobacillus bambusae]PWG00747.1 D-alanyl-lipoteichoic acid biosynthesis protein DltD [Levilactobacillus bambusae]
MGKRLFQIFGPLILAAALVLGIFLLPGHLIGYTANKKAQEQAAVSLSPSVLKGAGLKTAALDDGYVPFFGSSEWSRFDPMHPSVMAKKYHRSYQPFLLGSRGTQSLTQFYVMQNIQPQLKNQKAVFVISPQWFVKKGVDKAAFSAYYSQLQTTEWLNQYSNTKMDRYAAQRLMQMPSAKSDHIVYAALERVAKGQQMTPNQKRYLGLRQNFLKSEDNFFSGINLPNGNLKKVDQQEKKLPAQYSFSKINQLATDLGKKETDNNRFQISNSFYNHGLKQEVKHLKGFQENLSYLQSPEYSDFELCLDQFARLHTNVLFIIPPVNQKWADYTGLSQSMLKQFDQKIRYQLQSQGFNNIVDLSDKGDVPYFMTDTIHLGWKGWLAVDQRVDPFLTKKQKTPTYHINDDFYSNQWQQTTTVTN